MRSKRRLAAGLLAVLLPAGVSGQDVEMLGRRYGTTPPPGYFQERAGNPEAFRFQRGRAARMRAQAETRAALARQPGIAAALGPREGPVEGDYTIPVVMGLFQGSAQPQIRAADVQRAYFDDNPTGTVADYYEEVSGGRVSLTGHVRDWVQTNMTAGEVTLNQSGLVCCGIGDFVKAILDGLPPIDWGLYDNDGPDGIPNSGDDDGFVDALAVLHPTRGAECDENPSRIWSHKWNLTDASSSKSSYVTATPRNAAPEQFIRIDDYFVQGVLSCTVGQGINEIGVFVHETGHAFGLPDLYDTDSGNGRHDGAGTWELMASGTWGCDDDSPERPCHMGAWSKAMLGWVTVDSLPPDADLTPLTIPPVETSGVVYRVDALDGSGDYYLIENRRPLDGTFDQNVHGEGGLLVWQIDDEVVMSEWAANRVNAAPHMGVWLRQADGLNELGQSGGDRGDAGDPFPQPGNDVFHAASNPAAVTSAGSASGLTLLNIAREGNDITLQYLTRFNTVTLEVAPPTSPTGLFTVDGVAVDDPPSNTVRAAPFAELTVVAAGGEPVGPGERRPFLRWSDDPSAPRTRAVVTTFSDTSLVAEYGGLQYELRVDMTAEGTTATPGVVTTTPASDDLWFAPSTEVSVGVTAAPGFDFLAWTGELAGRPNPTVVVLDAPVFAGAEFAVVYEVVDAQVELMATVLQSVQLTVANATPPVVWRRVSGSLPQGMSFSRSGVIAGTPLDVGSFPLVVTATEAQGLTDTATVTLTVQAPALAIEDLASPFLSTSSTLSGVQQIFLDRQGNQNGAYDLGDFRAWVLANPDLPLAAEAAPAAAPEPRQVRVPMRLRAPEEHR